MYILEGCIKNLIKPHLNKNKTETAKFTSLLELKNIIITCADFICNHHTSCMTCNKVFKFNKLDKHICKDIDFLKPNISSSKKVSRKISKKLSKKVLRKISKKLSKKVSRKISKKLSKKVSRKISK